MNETFEVYPVFAHFVVETSSGVAYPKEPLGVFLTREEAYKRVRRAERNKKSWVPAGFKLLSVAVATRQVALYPEG